MRFEEHLRFPDGRTGKVTATAVPWDPENQVKLELERPNEVPVTMVVSRRFLRRIAMSELGSQQTKRGTPHAGRFNALDPARRRELALKGVEGRRKKYGRA